MQAESHFRAMGSDCHIVLVGARDGAADRARGEIERLERLWSRFIDTSEISSMNRGAGTQTTVSRETFELVRLAVEAWKATSGLFDPTVLRALEAAGYDRSFELLDEIAPKPMHARTTGCGEIELDADRLAIHMPPTVAFDAGGIGKGRAADLVVERMLDDGDARGVCVNLGGDLRTAGEPPDAEAWVIGVDHPENEGTIASIVVHEGGVATSSRARRRWALAGQTMHHIIDPRTGAPAVTDLVSVTTVAGEAWWAEVLSKVALIAGLEDAQRFLKELDTPALLTDAVGGVHAMCGMEAWLA